VHRPESALEPERAGLRALDGQVVLDDPRAIPGRLRAEEAAGVLVQQARQPVRCGQVVARSGRRLERELGRLTTHVAVVDEPAHQLARGRGCRAQVRFARHDLAQHEPVKEVRDLVHDLLGAEEVAEGLLVSVLVKVRSKRSRSASERSS
jgi:hypothetical protein